MDTSTPLVKQKKKAEGPSKSDINVSPISTVNHETAVPRSYSKRERKPRKWDDFEMSDNDPKVSAVKTKRKLKNISQVENVNDTSEAIGSSKVTESAITGDDSVDKSVLEKTDNSLLNDEANVAKAAKKRGRPKKVKNDNDKAETSTPIVGKKSVKMKDKNFSNNVNHFETWNIREEDYGDINERIEPDPEELKGMKKAVESKRKSKYIEKVDRVMPKSEPQSTVKNKVKGGTGNSVKAQSGSFDSGNVKTAVNGNYKKARIKLNTSKKEETKDGQNDSNDASFSTRNSLTKPPKKRGKSRKQTVISDVSCDLNSSLNSSKNLDVTDSLLDDSRLEESVPSVSYTSSTMPPKKRGRTSKQSVVSGMPCGFNNSQNDSKDLDDVTNISKDDSFVENSMTDFASHSLTMPKKKRGRQQKQTAVKDTPGSFNSSHNDSCIKEESMTEFASHSLTMPKKTPRRPPKHPVVSDMVVGFNDSENDSSMVLTPRSRGRPKRRNEDDEDVNDSAKKKKKFDAEKKKMRPAEKAKSLECRHCEYVGTGVTDIRRHYAIIHQIWWEIDHPIGYTDRVALGRVIEIKKFLNCPKCDKRLNFLQYYEKHLAWCGRENEVYTCEHCNKFNLKLQWKDLHLKTCPALREEILVTPKKESDEDDADSTTENGSKGSKRKAAKKAMSMVQKLSKSVDPGEEVDNSDDDPDADIDHEDEEEDDHDIDIEINENSDAGSEDNDDDIDDVIDNDKTEPVKFPQYAKYGLVPRANVVLDSYEISKKYRKEIWCNDLFEDWLPWKQDCKILSESESKPYMAEESSSVRFCFGRNEVPCSLKLNEGEIKHDFPIFYTGLPIWRLAWCPMPVYCLDIQMLAVTGKLRHSDIFLSDKKYSGPGIIQIWNTGITNNDIKAKIVPRLSYTVAHDFGMPTEMKWCPSGCYQTNKDKVDSAVYTRLGLLAVSFTDGTCRIFSLPHWSEFHEEAPPTLKATPTLSLIPGIGIEKKELVCSSIDWCLSKGHEKIIAGYSNGTIKIFNLVAESSLLKLSTEKYGRTLLPYVNMLPHGDLVRSVSWCSTSDHIIVTASEKFETVFRDLNNLGLPIHFDDQCFMTLKTTSGVALAGVLLSSDDNYTTQPNKGRYLESGSLMYLAKNNTRRQDCQTFYTSAQYACIWDMQSSEWFPLVALCDNRGVIVSALLRDMMKHVADNKSYRFRNDLFRTHIIEDQKPSQLPDCDQQNSSQSEMCQKCINQSENSSDASKSNDQSNSLLQCTCDKIDQSKHSKEILTHQDAAINNQTSGNIQEDESKECTTDKFKEMIVKGERRRKMESESSVLYFEENFEQAKKYRYDTIPDNHNDRSLASIKSLQFNPNNSQCCWLAFGGDTGLVRIANVRRLLLCHEMTHIKKNESLIRTGSGVT